MYQRVETAGQSPAAEVSVKTYKLTDSFPEGDMSCQQKKCSSKGDQVLVIPHPSPSRRQVILIKARHQGTWPEFLQIRTKSEATYCSVWVVIVLKVPGVGSR